MELTFPIEYHTDTPDFNDVLRKKVEKRFEKLTKRNRDITGASVAVKTVNGTSGPPEYQVRVVAYQKPDNTAVNEKGAAVGPTVLSAMESLERQVREDRDRRRQQWKRHQ